MSQYELDLTLEQFVPAEFTEFNQEISDQYPQIVDELRSGDLTKHPIEIKEPDIPADVPTFQQLVEKYADEPDLLNALLYLYKYIATPIVIDNFGTNDEARENWEKDIVEQHSHGNSDRGKFALTVVNQNKLRYNSLTNVFYGLQILMIFDNEYWQTSNYFARLRPEVASSDEYRALDFDQKLQLTEETTQLVYDLLRDIYQLS